MRVYYVYSYILILLADFHTHDDHLFDLHFETFLFTLYACIGMC